MISAPLVDVRTPWSLRELKLTSVHHDFPRAGALGNGAHLRIPHPQMAESRTGSGGHLDGHRRRRGEILRPDPRALPASRGQDDRVHRHFAPRHQACQRWQSVKGAGSRSRARRGAKGHRQQGRVRTASARQRCTRGPRAPGVASSQTFRTGGSVHGTTRAHLRGAPRDSLWRMPRALGLTRHAGQPHA
jgi:hypothetical protein